MENQIENIDLESESFSPEYLDRLAEEINETKEVIKGYRCLTLFLFLSLMICLLSPLFE